MFLSSNKGSWERMHASTGSKRRLAVAVGLLVAVAVTASLAGAATPTFNLKSLHLPDDLARCGNGWPRTSKRTTS